MTTNLLFPYIKSLMLFCVKARKKNIVLYSILNVHNVFSALYWLKMTPAFLGRMGITMCYEIICVVNPELYPTFLR